MDPQAHPIETALQARYFTLGSLNSSTPALWMVCHGYGQLAQYFIKHFQLLADAGHFVVAPEGLNRFYLQGFSGRVGASWMTSEERETDIQNYVHYLSAVHADAFKGHSAPLNLLGFSQGAITISRWSMMSGQAFNELILWAGIFPSDIPLDKALQQEQLKGKKVTVVYGDEDPLINEENKATQLKEFDSLKVKPRVISFSGKHELKQEVIKTHFLS